MGRSVTPVDQSLPRLAPDLTRPSDQDNGLNTVTITGIDGSSGIVTALSLTGKFAVNSLDFSALTNESITVELTIDGEIIMNDTFVVPGSTLQVVGTGATSRQEGGYLVRESLLLRLATTADNDATLTSVIRPLA